MKKIFVSVVIVCILTLSETIPSAQAGLGAWSSHLFVVNVSGYSDGYSLKMVNDPPGGQWGANIATKTDYPPVSLSMGWNYFSGTEYCGYNTAVQVVPGTPRYIYTSSTASTIYITKKTCAIQRYGSSNGKHIISSPGGTNYYDEWPDKQPLT